MMMAMRLCGFLLLLVMSSQVSAEPAEIVVIAGKKSHGPEGNGIHDYGWSARLVKVMLENSNVKDQVRVTVHEGGWPERTEGLERADSIMVISDGRDGELFEEAVHLATPERIEFMAKQMRRGCGLVTFHFSTFAPDRLSEQVLDWVGGYFDWETEGKRQWYSAIEVRDGEVGLVHPEHEICRGVAPFRMKEEFYFNLRFQPVDPGLVPLAQVAGLPGRDALGKTVVWARERGDGGRGFGTTCGHFYDNWKVDDFRKLVLNGLVWSAKVKLPTEGVVARFFERDEIERALSGTKETAKSIRGLLIAGNEAHKWHNWEKTTPVIKELLERDPRVAIDVVTDIEELGRRDLRTYQAIVLNYANWMDPTALSDASKNGLQVYLQRGGGLVVIHFANGAFHYSLPSAGGSDWPEYRRMVRRVWDHQGKGEAQSGHDAFGPFRVEVTSVRHPITEGLHGFEVTDELYFRQAGTEPVEALLEAHSQVTGKREPLAFAYMYGDGRVFQTFLGHSEKTYEAPEACEMLRRALLWVARHESAR